MVGNLSGKTFGICSVTAVLIASDRLEYSSRREQSYVRKVSADGTVTDLLDSLDLSTTPFPHIPVNEPVTISIEADAAFTGSADLTLFYLGYSPGSIDGIEGRNTQGAIRAFQADYGLTVDGIPGAATQKMLIGAIAGTAVKVEKPESSVVPKTGTFWDDIKYFTREEFRCPCGRCGGFPVEPQESMVRAVDEIRHRLGIPISIVDGGGSGVRCAAHNAEVGGVANSQHLYGLAADLHSAASPAQMKAVAEDVMGRTGGIGLYDWGIHVDTRQGYARWKG